MPTVSVRLALRSEGERSKISCVEPSKYHRPISFQLDERKATEAAAILLERAGGEMDHLRLLKLMYLADRESFAAHGRPISGDVYVSMEHGPVLSHVYNFIKNDPRDRSETWSHAIQKTGTHRVRLSRDVQPAALSDADVRIIHGTHERFGNMSTSQLRNFTHTLPEWRDPGKSCLPIDLGEILRALGKTEAEMEEIRLASLAQVHFDSIFPRR